ncbi:HlyD family secretion protein [Anaeromyxobacter oryzae]|uniref:Secretion protein HylD n=1 Tax=Anaeromyxobacter oryzae TaxID=2918170 RepID=A0ABM7WQC9_9BACT|nr:HlyD family efflux transporter periplasmic adaptor subunit [Anaeromyxobacter oryzae]BDG01669.1 secretion protein HylD [Anaeromyxobacter oryzae]
MGTVGEIALPAAPDHGAPPEPSPGTEHREGRPGRRGPWVLGAAACLVAAVAVTLAVRHVQRAAALPDGLIQVNGRLEGDTVTVAGKLAGRVATLAVREGDVVVAGQVLATLDDATPRARLAQAHAAEEAARARVGAARADLAVLRQSVPLTIAAAEASAEAAQASLAKARVSAEQALRDRDRARALREGGSIDAQTEERTELASRIAEEELRRSRADALRTERQLADARLGPERIAAKAQEVEVLEAAARQASAQVAEAAAVLDDLRIASPTSGTVITRFVEAGEVVGAGAPLLELVDLDRLYLEVFVREQDVGRVRLGLPARVFTDAFPDEPFPAEVRFIASRAEFTPKEVQTPDERTRLVYAVKLYLAANPDHRLGPGLSADALIRWKEGVSWVKPRW